MADCQQRQLVASSMHRAQLECHKSQIADAPGNKLFKIVAKLLFTDNNEPLPPRDSFDTIAQRFSDFFFEKISRIRSALIQNINSVGASIVTSIGMLHNRATA